MVPRAKRKSPRLAGTGGDAAKRLKELCFISAAVASFFWLSYAAGITFTMMLMEVR
jgi:hypothetical protein